MMTEYITLFGFILTVLVTGIALGRHIEKVDRLLRMCDKEEDINKKSKSNRL